MGPLGWPETVFIVILALLLFGPKKLPELGRNVAKAIAEFRKHSNDLKATFDREMRNLERETEGVKELAESHFHDTYNYDYSAYDSGAPYTQPASVRESVIEASAQPALPPAESSASAPEGAESNAAAPHPAIVVSTPGEAIPSASFSDGHSAVQHSGSNGASNSHGVREHEPVATDAIAS